jgi:restriction system protein
VEFDQSVSVALLTMPWKDFEYLCCDLLRRMDLEAKVTKSSHDEGIDVIAIDHRPIVGGKIVIQCKRWTNTIKVSDVRDLYGSMTHENASKGIFMTTSTFSPDCINCSLLTMGEKWDKREGQEARVERQIA